MATVVLLGVALVGALLQPSGDPEVPTPVVAAAAPIREVSEPTTIPSELVATPPLPTTVARPPDRMEELHAMAHAAYVGWFDAIYRSDPESLARWVATAGLVEAGHVAMAGGTIAFTNPPTEELVALTVDGVLRDSPWCVVLRTTDDVSRFIDAAVPSRSVITVYWPDEASRLRMATRWGAGTPATVWSADCARRPARSVS